MKSYLSNYWNTGVAIGELFSSFMLVFLVLSIKAISKVYIKNKQTKIFVVPFLYGLATFASLVVGWSIGNNISMGSGKSFLTPIFAIVNSIYYSAGKALPMILGFQIIGSIIGAGLFLIFKYVLVNYSESFKLSEIHETKEMKFKVKMTKESLAQLFLVVPLSLVLIWAPIGQNIRIESDQIIQALMLVLVFIVLTIVFYPLDGYVFTPWISLIELCFNYSKQNLIYIISGISIQTTLSIAMGYALYALGHSNHIV